MAKSRILRTPGSGNERADLEDYRYTDPVGSVFYVNSANGSDTTGYGRSPESPFATIDYAIGQCTASNGDEILVCPNHAESVTAAAGIALDVIGVTIRGLGRGRNRPTITFTTAAGASFDISAADCRVENLTLVCNIDDQTSMINVSAADCELAGLELVMGDATYDAEAGITVADAGDRILVENCHLYSGSTTAITTGAIVFGAADNSVIRNNLITGYFGTAGAIVNSAAAVGVLVDGNRILNYSADGNNKAIVLHGSTSGLVANNRGGIIDSTAPAPVTAAAAWVAGNYWSSAVGVTASVLM